MNTFNVNQIRNDFPILRQQVNGKPLIYFDNGATAQKPQCVIDCLEYYYKTYNSNVHRGAHHLSQVATEAYEKARGTIAQYVNAEKSHEIIFTKGTTDSINLVAFSLGETLQEGDEIIITAMEHHSNIVPWQMLCKRKKCALKVVPINKNGELLLDEYQKLLSSKTKLVAVTHVSNSLGTVNPVAEMITMAHEVGAQILVDGAQSIQHFSIDVQKLDCDFYVFSGHKVFGPTGIGVLYGKEAILNKLPPYQGGGDMIERVTFEKTSYNVLPYKFEAGTPNIAGGIALGEAFAYLASLPMKEITQYEYELLTFATEEIKKIDNIRIIGQAENKVSVLSFVADGIHPYDLGVLLDKMGVAVRTGHHCTQPLMDFFQIPGTARASFAFYNTKEEVVVFIASLKKALHMLR